MRDETFRGVRRVRRSHSGQNMRRGPIRSMCFVPEKLKTRWSHRPITDSDNIILNPTEYNTYTHTHNVMMMVVRNFSLSRGARDVCVVGTVRFLILSRPSFYGAFLLLLAKVRLIIVIITGRKHNRNIAVTLYYAIRAVSLIRRKGRRRLDAVGHWLEETCERQRFGLAYYA